MCEELTSDTLALRKLGDKRITVVRFEDLAQNPVREAKRIYEELDLTYTTGVETFLKTHTTDSSQTLKRSSTYRNSSAVVFQWKEKLTRDEIDEIQKRCAYVFQRGEYEII